MPTAAMEWDLLIGSASVQAQCGPAAYGGDDTPRQIKLGIGQRWKTIVPCKPGYLPGLAALTLRASCSNYFAAATDDGAAVEEDDVLMSETARAAPAAARNHPLRLTIAQALNHMAQTLATSQEARQRLDLQLRHLREDERSRLARELHDELGQRLTAMRADTAWLMRRSVDQPPINDVTKALADHCEHVQHTLRDLLQRLREHRPYEDEDGPLPLHRLLRKFVDSWRERPDQLTQFALEINVDEHAIAGDVAMTLYRFTQEALTNIARHAHASQVNIRLALLDDDKLEWSVCDDGNGLTDAGEAAHRGNGLFGMRERVWELHGEIEMFATHPDRARPGLTISARLPLHSVSVATSADDQPIGL